MNIKKIYLIATSFLFISCIEAQQKKKELCDLTVRVENIKTIKGNLKLGIFDERKNFLESAVAWNDKNIDANTMTVIFPKLKVGIYALSIYQDKNNNGKLDVNLLGIPSEPYAFSNNAKGLFGPPKFEDCKFEVLEGRQEIVVYL